MNTLATTMTEPSDADLKAVEPAIVVKIAAAVLGVAGLMIALVGLQLIGLHFYRYPELGYVKFGYMLSGVVSIALAAQLYRARPWAPIAAGAVASLTAIALFAWLVFLFADVFSCLAIISLPLMGLSAILAFASIPAVQKTVAARNRLASQGMPLGF